MGSVCACRRRAVGATVSALCTRSSSHRSRPVCKYGTRTSLSCGAVARQKLTRRPCCRYRLFPHGRTDRRLVFYVLGLEGPVLRLRNLGGGTISFLGDAPVPGLQSLKMFSPAVSKIRKRGAHVRTRITGQILKGLIPPLHVPVPACRHCL